MRKIITLFVIAFSMLPVNALGCVCAPHINTIFSDMQAYIISENITPAKNNLANNLIPNINKNTDRVKAEIEILKILIAQEQLKIMKMSEINHALRKNNSLTSLSGDYIEEKVRTIIFNSELQTLINQTQIK